MTGISTEHGALAAGYATLAAELGELDTPVRGREQPKRLIVDVTATINL